LVKGFREYKSPVDTYTASPLNATSGPTFNLPVSVQGYPITVGAGGTAGNAPTASGQGGTSTFSNISSAKVSFPFTAFSIVPSALALINEFTLF